MTLEKFETIRARQIPDAEKRAKADFVVDTDKGLDHAYVAIKEIVETLRARRK
jgi:dephospho-CoA kinase